MVVAFDATSWPDSAVGANVRVICDNDFAGDPDGLIQLAHHLLSPSVDIVGVIGTHHHDPEAQQAGVSLAANAVREAKIVARLCNREDVPMAEGSDVRMTDRTQPIDSAAVQMIIAEALREDDRPLFICCGAGLGEIASAWLLEPRIAERVTIVWIGGRAYGPSVSIAERNGEYNLELNPIAAHVVFNDSNLQLWQFPRDAYRQTLASRTELMVRMGEVGELGAHLWQRLGQYPRLFEDRGAPRNETYCLGDSPLVLATALLSFFDPEPASSEWIERACPQLDADGNYVENSEGRTIRVFTKLDNRMWLEDFYAKLLLHARCR